MSLTPQVQTRGLGVIGGTIERLPAAWTAEGAKALRRSGQSLVTLWKLKLSGPAGPGRLGVGTGQLRRSIAVDRQRSGKDLVIVGSDAKYAAVHEFGYDGYVNVRAHTRRVSVKRRVLATSIRTRKTSRRQTSILAGYAQVKAHARHMRMPRRPHRAPALRAHRPIHSKFMAGALTDAVRESVTSANRSKFFGKMAFLDVKAAGGTGRRTYPR